MLVLALSLALLVQDPSPPSIPLGSVVVGEVDEDTPPIELWGPDEPDCAADRWSLSVEERGTFTLDLRSFHFNAFLRVTDDAARLVAMNVNGPIGKHAQVVLSLAPNRNYRVEAGALHGVLGSYELLLSAGSPSEPTAGERRRLELEDASLRVAVLEEERPQSFELAWALENLATVHSFQGRPGEARPLFERALAMLEAVRGPTDPSTGECAMNLGIFLWEQEELVRAQALHEQALAAFDEHLHPDHDLRASALTNLGVVYKALARYDDALALYREAVDILERTLPFDTQTGSTLNNYARLLQATGHYQESQAMFERALGIFERAYGPVDSSVAVLLGNLGGLLWERQDFAGARPLLERALEISESLHGPDHPQVALALANLGMLVGQGGDDLSSIRYLERALEISERAGNPSLRSTALGNLADAYGRSGELARAEAMFEQALAIDERNYGVDHVRTTTALSNLGSARLQAGRTVDACTLFERALGARRKTLGQDHLLTARSQAGLGLALTQLGELDRAREQHEQALATRRRVLGEESLATAESLRGLARVALLSEEDEPGRAYLVDAYQAARGFLGNQLFGLTEAERYGAVKELREHLDTVLSIEEWSGSEDAAATLAWKGQLLRLLVSGREAEHALGPEVRALRDRLFFLRGNISNLALGPKPDVEQLRRWKDEATRLELELGAVWREAGFRLNTPSVADVIAALPADGALVDVIEHRTISATPLPRSPDAASGTRLTAFVYRSGLERPARIDLGPTAPVTAATSDYLEALVGELGVARGVGLAPSSAAAAFEESGRLLHDRVWAPLEESIGSATTVFICPDGPLGALPLGAVRDRSGAYLLESRRFVVLEDPAALIRSLGEGRVEGERLLAVGGMDYGAGSGSWSALAGTALELEAIAELHPGEPEDVLRLEGSAPTEEALCGALAGSRWVHLATHGFFEPEALSVMDSIRSGPTSDLTPATQMPAGLPPGLLSGLICAGANDSTDGGERLTSSEIALLDLSACELAVLSACSTGLGSRRGGEGMLSVQRAFHAAGSRTVVASLWRVDDASTAELVRRFYTNLWQAGSSKLDALRDAQLSMLSEKRAAGETTGAPFAWAAFVLSGDWR